MPRPENFFHGTGFRQLAFFRACFFWPVMPGDTHTRPFHCPVLLILLPARFRQDNTVSEPCSFRLRSLTMEKLFKLTGFSGLTAWIKRSVFFFPLVFVPFLFRAIRRKTCAKGRMGSPVFRISGTEEQACRRWKRRTHDGTAAETGAPLLFQALCKTKADDLQSTLTGFSAVVCLISFRTNELCILAIPLIFVSFSKTKRS